MRKNIARESFDAWNSQKYHCMRHGGKPRVFVVGESHYNAAFQQKQLELLDLVRPSFVLHELVGAIHYNPCLKQISAQTGRLLAASDVAEIKSKWRRRGRNTYWYDFFEKADQCGFFLEGWDLTAGEALQAYHTDTAVACRDGYDLEWKKHLSDIKAQHLERWRGGRGASFDDMCDWLCALREAKMLQILGDIVRRTSGNVIAIQGAAHSAHIYARGGFLKLGCDYIVIIQSARKI